MTQGRSDDEIRDDVAAIASREWLTKYGLGRLAADAGPLLARAVAAECGEDDQRAMLRDARAELAAAQAATKALGEAVVELVEQKPSMGPGMLRDMVLRHCAALAAASGVAPDKPAPTCEHGETGPHDTFTVHMWPPPVRPVTCPGPDDAPDHDHRKAWDAHVTASRQAGLCEYSGMTVQRCKDINLCDCFDQPNGDDDAHS